MQLDSQTELIFEAMLPEGQKWFTAKELGDIVEVCENLIRDRMDNDEILGLKITKKDQSKKKRRYRTHRIPRAGAVIWLATHANFTASDLERELCHIFTKLPRETRRNLYLFLGNSL